MLLFALGVSLLTGMLFGIAPAWTTSHAEPVEALRGANRSTAHGARWPQKALVIAQASVSLVLISAAVMLAQSLRNLEHQKFGFEIEGRYMVSIDAFQAGYKPEQLDLAVPAHVRAAAADPGRSGRCGSHVCPDERR